MLLKKRVRSKFLRYEKFQRRFNSKQFVLRRKRARKLKLGGKGINV